MLTRTPHICCFVLVFFAVLISAVHAMPTPPSSPPRAHALIDSTLDRPFLPLDLPPFNVDKAEIDFDIEDLPKASPYRLTMLHAFDSSTTFPIFGSTARRGFTSTITKRLLAGKLKFPENNNGIRYTNKEVDKDSSIRDILPDDVIFVFEALEPNAPICGGIGIDYTAHSASAESGPPKGTSRSLHQHRQRARLSWRR
ncbi:hypothetical protein BDP27DRAFT_1362495 [Rhodocollybia butyracea]|uniref:Uncharacterized protein n=1 Tax=Rhodocollybia butyracea TaxID=206335 RepID=A0A9P5U941_9AGAR|nr:hypothetical protein BDP27DRAFT_1362495 [Rhodocollybia butyracea]